MTVDTNPCSYQTPGRQDFSSYILVPVVIGNWCDTFGWQKLHIPFGKTNFGWQKEHL
jgi:hypothetical protein